MSEKEYTIADMISTARAESPSEFQNAFNDVMMDKVRAVVDAQKAQLAQQYFNNDQKEQENLPSEDDAEEVKLKDETDEDIEPSSESEG